MHVTVANTTLLDHESIYFFVINASEHWNDNYAFATKSYAAGDFISFRGFQKTIEERGIIGSWLSRNNRKDIYFFYQIAMGFNPLPPTLIL